MPKAYEYLNLRMQIEQQRFLNFGLEAGILYADGVICTNLLSNRSLLLAVLAEIKTLLEKYATTKANYEDFIPQDLVNLDNCGTPDTILMELLYFPSMNKNDDGKGQTSRKREEYFQRLRKFGKGVTQAGRNLRTIVREPKRLVWVAVDKESFENLISKLKDLVSFLATLLDKSQIRRLQDTMSTTYLEVLQVRNNIESLIGLVRALAPTEKRLEEAELRPTALENQSFSNPVHQEAEVDRKARSYIRKLVEIKIQYTKMDQLSSESSNPSEPNQSFGTQIELDKLEFNGNSPDPNDVRQRTYARYQEASVWIEWKGFTSISNLHPANNHVKNRIGLLTDFLRHDKPTGFRAPSCLGYIETVDEDNEARFGIVFQKPMDAAAKTELQTLRTLMKSHRKPSLSARTSLCAVLARCIHSFHAVNWLHKGLRADNIIFFSSPVSGPNLSEPFVSGYELSRPSIIDTMTEKPVFNPLEDIYRHPSAQSSRTDGNYRKSYDIYSLGIILLEIALWKRVEDIIGFEGLEKVKPLALQEIQSRLLGRSQSGVAASQLSSIHMGPYLQQVTSECGDAFCDIIECCLTTDSLEIPQYKGEPDPSIALRLQSVMEDDVVKRLERVAHALQGRT